MTAVAERACEILEKHPGITVEEAQRKITLAKDTYDCLYSDFIQRRNALQSIEVYTLVLEMLGRRK